MRRRGLQQGGLNCEYPLEDEGGGGGSRREAKGGKGEPRGRTGQVDETLTKGGLRASEPTRRCYTQPD